MAAGCVGRILNALRQAHILLPHYYHPSGLGGVGRGTYSRYPRLCSKVAGGADVTSQSLKKKQDPRARQTIGSIGRKIHHRHLQVLGASGEDLGTMHRSNVIRLMDQQGLKLVPVNLDQEPPVYRLMTGKQIHEEQLKLREKEKAKSGPVLVKEVTFSIDIHPHDLCTKLRQIQGWLECKNHVRVTLKSRGGQPKKPLDKELEHMVQGMECEYGFVTRPQLIRDGKAALCILRAPSKKEVQQSGTARNAQPPRSGVSKKAPPSSGDPKRPLPHSGDPESPPSNSGDPETPPPCSGDPKRPLASLCSSTQH